MKNLNSKSEMYPGKKVFDNTVHHGMPEIKHKRRRTAYKGIVNQSTTTAADTKKESAREYYGNWKSTGKGNIY